MASHKEKIMNALSLVPIATTEQIGMMLDCSQPSKKASYLLKQLEQGGQVEWRRYAMKKAWSLSQRFRRLKGFTFPKTTSLHHTLMISNMYFSLQGEHLQKFHFEPRYDSGKSIYSPDAMIVYNRKAHIVELQLERLSRKQWAKKWSAANTFFNEGHFEKSFQEEYDKVFLPRFVCVTDQSPDIVKEGFEVKNRSLIVVKSIKEIAP